MNIIKKSDFSYNLPEKLIAQTPVEPRDLSRLMVIDRTTGEITHSRFREIANFLRKGDLLVLNDSKVFPARLYGVKRESGIAVEFLLSEQKSFDIWETLVRPGRRLKKGAIVDFFSDFCNISAEIIDTVEDGNRLVKFKFSGDFFDILDKIGHTPLPPYIKENFDNLSRYNTIYSSEPGSSAAPTAGLHFTERVFSDLSEKGVDTAFVTLHVGLGTFRPVKSENILEHKMHAESYSIPAAAAEKINACKARGGRVIAVGTTSCRTLESAALEIPELTGKMSASTSIFIYPGYRFNIIDGLITNFHLPESTLIMLVSAFMGRERTIKSYREAIKEKYRFFSFGDAMLIID